MHSRVPLRMPTPVGREADSLGGRLSLGPWERHTSSSCGQDSQSQPAPRGRTLADLLLGEHLGQSPRTAGARRPGTFTQSQTPPPGPCLWVLTLVKEEPCPQLSTRTPTWLLPCLSQKQGWSWAT